MDGRRDVPAPSPPPTRSFAALPPLWSRPSPEEGSDGAVRSSGTLASGTPAGGSLAPSPVRPPPGNAPPVLDARIRGPAGQPGRASAKGARKAKGAPRGRRCPLRNHATQLLHKWESDLNTPSVDQFPAIANYLGISIDEIHGALGGEAPTSLDVVRAEVSALRRDLDTLKAAIRAQDHEGGEGSTAGRQS